jgi:hypothetical protein
MTSSTSSNPDTTRRGIARFPPRSELPPDMTIIRLPFLGRTWYERSFWYWCRRIWGVILLIITVAIYAGIITGVMNAAGPPGSPGYLAVLIGETVFSLVTAVFTFRHLWQLGASGRALRGNPRATRAGVGASFLAFKAGVLGAVLLAASALLTAGFALGALAIWLTPVPPTEQFARRMLAEELQLRQNRPHTSGHHHKH